MRRMPALDHLRGFAIISVMLMHFLAPLPGTFYGYLGVDLFFVLSGFLITGLLVDARPKSETGGDFFRVFYLRRALRIFPVYYVFLLAMWVAVTIVRGHSHPWWMYLMYVQNFEPGSGSTRDFVLGHLWSLAIEEQFYLVWPFLVWFVPSKRLPAICVVLAGLALALRILFATHISGEMIFRETPFRMDSLALGGLAATWSGARKWAPAATVLGVTLYVGVQWQTNGITPVAYTAAAVAFAGLVSWSSTATRIPGPQILAVIGTYSYAMYLFHLPMHMFIAPYYWALAPRFLSRAVAVVIYALGMMTLVFVAARVSWVLIERPFLRMKDRVTPLSSVEVR